MSVQSRLFAFSSLVPASLLLGMGTTAMAQESHADHAGMATPAQGQSVAVKQTRWSDPAS